MAGERAACCLVYPSVREGRKRNEPVRGILDVICDLVGGQNSKKLVDDPTGRSLTPFIIRYRFGELISNLSYFHIVHIIRSANHAAHLCAKLASSTMSVTSNYVGETAYGR